MAAVLPSARSVQVGTPATTFATIINTDSSSFPSKLQISVTHSELGIVQRVGLRTAVSWSHAVSMKRISNNSWRAFLHTWGGKNNTFVSCHAIVFFITSLINSIT
jgi:hypothetical protein